MPAPGMRWLLLTVFSLQFVHHTYSAPPVRLHAVLGDDVEFERELHNIFGANGYEKDASRIPVRYNQGKWEYLTYTDTKWEVEKNKNGLSEIQDKISKAEKVVLEFHSEGKMGNNYKFAGGKTAQEMSDITVKLFPKRDSSKYNIRVVFPESCTATTEGLQFIDNFISKMPSSKYNVKMGLTKIDVYPVFDKITPRQLTGKERTYFYLQYNAGVWEFVHYENGIWAIEDVSKQKENRELLAEAEKVVIVMDLEFSKPNKNPAFNMVGKSPEDLADMFKSLLPQKEHLHQRVRVRFSSAVTNIPDGQKFSKKFIEKMKEHQPRLDIYGLEPRLKVHTIFDGDRLFEEDLKDKFRNRKLYKDDRNVAARYKDNKWHFLKYENELLKKIRNSNKIDQIQNRMLEAEELEIQINAHGSLESEQFKVAERRPKQLADKLGKLLPKNQLKAQRIQLTFQCCNVGSTQGQEYVKAVTEHMKNDWHLNVKESISYNGWTKARHRSVFSVWIPTDIKHSAQNVLDGKFTIQDRHKWREQHGKYRYNDKLKRRHMIRSYEDESGKFISERLAPFYEHESQVRKRIKTDFNRESQNEIVRNSNINLPNDADSINQEIQNNIQNNLCRRMKRSPGECSLDDLLEKEYQIQEDSIKQVDGEIRFKLVRNGVETEVSVPIDHSKLFYTASMEEFAHYYTEESRSMGLEGVGHGLAVYGVVMGFVGAKRYFSEGDIARGSISLSQSIHSIGSLSGANKVISKVATRYVQMAIEKSAVKLGAGKVLEKVTAATAKVLGGSAGRFLRAVPVVGLAFDVYMIEEDIQDIVNMNFSNPSNMEYLPLKLVDLVLDVDVAGLSIAEAAFPPVAAIATPLIIAITFARLAIGDVYTDILEELKSLKQDASGWDKFEAFFNGLEEGLLDATTGGLFRNKKLLEKKYEQNLDLLRNLSDTAHYFKTDGQTIDFTGGDLSSYGGFITLNLEENGFITVQIGRVPDGHGGSKTITQTLYHPDVKDVILGLGKSGRFLYKEESAYLWWIIPVESRKIICGRVDDDFSLFGTYYGNSQDNAFYTVQRPAPGKEPSKPLRQGKGEECSVGMVQSNSGTIFSNYHYFIEAQNGQDTFFLGPQQAHVSGGDGSDFYILPEDGGQKSQQLCPSILSCRQQCNNIIVPNGSPNCKGNFEGDTCRPSCSSGHILEGPSSLQCVKSQWIGEGVGFPFCLRPPTTGGNSNGAPCKFPFKYNNKDYYYCTTDNEESGRLWCATVSNYAQDPKWGYCPTSGIVTVGGTDPGKECVFPFSYENQMYFECTTINNNHIPWCATTSDYPRDNKWGNCPFTGPPTTGGNSNGAPCKFPFKYNNKDYYYCTTDNEESGRLWCATVSNYAQDPKWGYCPTSGIVTVGGTDPGKECVFPFSYENQMYFECTTINNNHIPWCATTSDYPRDNKWGNCPFTGPPTTGGNSNGAPCKFPFKYNDKDYYYCTTDNEESGRLWCATVSNYAQDPKWGYCPTSGKLVCVL
ncbi:UNVERIFIED_CONTAM: hypothetical protein FKN15_035936 [Acipenser sinensis]